MGYDQALALLRLRSAGNLQDTENSGGIVGSDYRWATNSAYRNGEWIFGAFVFWKEVTVRIHATSSKKSANGEHRVLRFVKLLEDMDNSACHVLRGRYPSGIPRMRPYDDWADSGEFAGIDPLPTSVVSQPRRFRLMEKAWYIRHMK